MERGLAPWEAQKLRNLKVREIQGKVQKARVEQAIAALQGKEEEPPAAAEAPPAAEEAATSSAQPPIPKIISRWKTTICRNWNSGFCKRGNKFGFAHGKEELRPRDDQEPPAKKARAKPPQPARPPPTYSEVQELARKLAHRDLPEPDGYNFEGLPVRKDRYDSA